MILGQTEWEVLKESLEHKVKILSSANDINIIS